MYRKFSNKGAGRGGKTLGALPLESRHFQLPVVFYRMKIGPLLAEICQKNVQNLIRLGVKKGGGRPYRGWRP